MSRRKWLRTVEALLERDGPICRLCTKPLNSDVSIDHIIPQSHGGRHSLKNLRLAHRACNEQRGSKECPQCGGEGRCNVSAPLRPGEEYHRELARANALDVLRHSICSR